MSNLLNISHSHYTVKGERLVYRSIRVMEPPLAAYHIKSMHLKAINMLTSDLKITQIHIHMNIHELYL